MCCFLKMTNKNVKISQSEKWEHNLNKINGDREKTTTNKWLFKNKDKNRHP